MDARVVYQSFFRIIEAVVRQADNEQVFPLRKRLELVDKFSQTVVCKGEGIGNFFVQAVVRYFERLVAAKSQKGRVPRLVASACFYLLVEMFKSDVIVHSPGIFAFFQAEIHVGREMLVTTA